MQMKPNNSLTTQVERVIYGPRVFGAGHQLSLLYFKHMVTYDLYIQDVYCISHRKPPCLEAVILLKQVRGYTHI